MISVFIFLLLTFGGAFGILGLAFYGFIVGDAITFDFSPYLWFFVGVCVGTSLAYRLCVSIKDAKSPLYRELQSYIDRTVSSVPELSDLKVKLHFTNESYFQGSALPKRHIYLSRPWVNAASVCNESLEYAKLTLCHELYHISCRHRYPFSFMPFLVTVIGPFYKSFRDNYYIKKWHEELNADRMACIWHGDRKLAIAKMEALKNLCSGKERLTDHPAWDIRIRYLQEDIVPTMDNVTAEYRNYSTYLKNKCCT